MNGMSGETTGSRLPGWLFLLVLGGIPIVILSFVAVLFDISSHGATTPYPYNAHIQGLIPVAQHLNKPVTLRFAVRNTGASIPQLVMLFSGLDAWTISHAQSDSAVKASPIDTLGNGVAWQFGPLAKHQTIKIVLDARPVRTGHPSVTLTVFAGIDSSGSPDPTLEIKGDGETWSGLSITR